ncbi:MAG: hypothetical protein ABIQ15_02095 [Nocardioides sp.]
MTSHAPRRTRLGATAALAAGSVVSGLLAYVFFALVTRGLGAATAAPVSVLWSYWGFAAAGVTFPVQHWIARSVAADGHERAVRAALPTVAALSVAASAVVGLLAWLLRAPLFRDDGLTWPVLVVAVTLGSAAMGLVRGVLASRQRYGAVGGVLVAENLVRCAVAEVLLSSGVTDPAAYGGALLAGYAALLAWPSAWRLASGARAARTSVGFLGGAALGQVAGQAVLTGGPVLLALAHGAPSEVTALFAGLALARVPYTLVLGQVSQLTGMLTELVLRGDGARLRRLWAGLVAGTLVVAAVAAALGAWAGPPLLRWIFGADVTLGSGQSLVLAVGTTFALANLVLTVLVLAHDRAPLLGLTWAAAVVPGVVLYALGPGTALDRTAWTFALVEVGAWLGLLLAADRSGRRLRA